MSIPHSLTKQEALRQIAELQRHIDSLPKNNHPEKIEKGMLFRHRDGETYMVAYTTHDDFRLVQVTQTEHDDWRVCGNLYSGTKLFGIATDPSDFEYLGHAKDLLILKPTINDDVTLKAYRYYNQLGVTMKETLQAFIDGKFN